MLTRSSRPVSTKLVPKTKLISVASSEFDAWVARCPVANYEARLLAEGAIAAREVERMRGEIGAEIADAFEFARSSPFPDPEELGRFVYPAPGKAS